MIDAFASRVSDSLIQATRALSTALSTLLVGVLSIKNVPGFWHLRIMRGMYYHLYFQPHRPKPQDLFKPLITSTTNSLYDCDWNCHKSNSTYFSDLDVARTHLMSCICRGITRLNDGEGSAALPSRVAQAPGKYALVLAGVACHFHREMEPLRQFEIWTRVMCWDQRSIYCVSHIVKKGARKPTSFVLQPWRQGDQEVSRGSTDDAGFANGLYASSIARYVVRKGAMATVKPEVVLELSQLLPSRPQEGGQKRHVGTVSSC